jgi:predicted enzyme involved in methoxymalonyl-ACP biosynthesis
MSCRVMNRGVGSVLINYIRNEAREAGVRLLAEMLPNNRNRIMYMTYKFNHFMERETSENRIVFENNLDPVIDYPRYVKLELG